MAFSPTGKFAVGAGKASMRRSIRTGKAEGLVEETIAKHNRFMKESEVKDQLRDLLTVMATKLLTNLSDVHRRRQDIVRGMKAMGMEEGAPGFMEVMVGTDKKIGQYTPDEMITLGRVMQKSPIVGESMAEYLKQRDKGVQTNEVKKSQPAADLDQDIRALAPESDILQRGLAAATSLTKLGGLKVAGKDITKKPEAVKAAKTVKRTGETKKRSSTQKSWDDILKNLK